MKKKTLILLVGVIVLLVLWAVSGYNGMVNAEVTVDQEWSNVETQYQRRNDLIGNLVATVKGYAEHEKNTLSEVIAARAAATQTTINAQDLTPEKMQQFQQVQGELSSALGRLLVSVERYPELKANQNFLENRIQVARQRYNETAGVYNKKIRKFPNNILAGIFGFDKKPFFDADPEASKAPKVEF